jgi:hypothetical protein
MPDLVVHTYNPVTWEAEVEGSRVQGQPGIHSETLSQTNKQTKNAFYKLNTSNTLIKKKHQHLRSAHFLPPI